MKKISILLAVLLLVSVFTQTVFADETTSTTVSEETTTTLIEETTTTLGEEMTTTLPSETTLSTTLATTLGKQQTVTPKLIIMNRKGNITARVLNANRSPVVGIRVTLQLGSTKMNVVTDQNGYAEFAMPFPKDNAFVYCSTQQVKIGNTVYLAAEASTGKKVNATTKKTSAKKTTAKKTTAAIAQQTEATYYTTYYTTGETVSTEQQITTVPTTAVKRSEMGGVVDIVIVLLWLFGLSCVGVGIFLLFRFVINPKKEAQEAEAFEEEDEQEETLDYETEQSFWDADEPAPLPKAEKSHDIDIPL